MSVWVLKLAMTAEEEQAIGQRKELPLPYHGLPDIRGAHQPNDLRDLMLRLNPDTPPETIGRTSERIWGYFTELKVEDLIVVPFSHSNAAALAQVVIPYLYHSEHGQDIHTMEVIWLETNIPCRKFGEANRLIKMATGLLLIEHAEDRKPIYRLLKRPYNRFAKLRWIIGILFLMQAAMMLIGSFKS